MENKSAYEIKITKDKMKALLSFETAEAAVTAEEIMGELQKLGVRNGILKDKLESILQNRHVYTDYVIAEGLEPTEPFPGKVEYFFETVKDMKPSVDKDGNVNVMIGKVSFSEEALAQNFKALYDQLAKIRPASVKGTFMKSVTVSTTMGPGVRVTVE